MGLVGCSREGKRDGEAFYEVFDVGDDFVRGDAAVLLQEGAGFGGDGGNVPFCADGGADFCVGVGGHGQEENGEIGTEVQRAELQKPKHRGKRAEQFREKHTKENREAPL